VSAKELWHHLFKLLASMREDLLLFWRIIILLLLSINIHKHDPKKY
jgi:hypothetical protein